MKMYLRQIFAYIIKSNLLNKVILSFVVLATIPVLILGGLAIYLIDLSHRFDVSSLESQLIDQKIEEIDKFFADTLGIIQLQVGYPQKAPIGPEEQKFILEGILADSPAFVETSFIDVPGLVVNDIPTVGGMESAKIIRGKGVPELFDVSKLIKYSAALTDKAFIGDVYQTTSGPMVTIASPVKNRNGDIIQILSAEVSLNQINRSISASSLGFAGGLSLLDRGGAVIASKNAAAVPGSDLSGFTRIREIINGKIFDALGDGDRYESLINRTSVIGAGKKMVSTDWIIFAEWPISDADAIIDDVRKQVFSFTLVGIIAVLALAPFFALRITRPIRDLQIGASKVEGGEFGYRVNIKTKDELSDLGSAFNKMCDGLKRLQELKNEFVFIAAHELRTPVTAIKGYLSMIMEGDAGPVSDSIKKLVEPVLQANDRLIQLINDILEIARSDAGRIKIQVFAVNIRAAVKSVIKDILPLANEKKISLEYAIGYDEPIDMPLVMADTTRLREVVTNFVSNAIKYGREGGYVKIYHETDVQYITTHIEDNGMGIPKKEQAKVFEKFFRSEASRMGQIQGTGLGLFITKELVEKMGGSSWFQSEETKGTRFSFKLPRPKQ